MKALEVLVNGEFVGLYVPPEGECFGVVLGNVPRTYMRAQVSAGSKTESWYWQLPDIKEGETISFRLVEAAGREGVPPQRRVSNDPIEQKRIKQAAAKAWAKAKRQISTKKNRRGPTKRSTGRAMTACR
jgi:hypothetical protein